MPTIYLFIIFTQLSNYGSHGGSLFPTGIKFDRQGLSSFPVEMNSNPVRRTWFLREKVSLRGFRSNRKQKHFSIVDMGGEAG